MPWVRIDEEFARHPKVMAAGPLGMAMQVAALCYCNQYLTDGFIPRTVVAGLLDFAGLGMRMWQGDLVGGGEDATWQLVVEDLLEAGLWVEELSRGGYRIHDYHDYQPSKEEALKLRADRAAAGQKGGKASAKARGQASAEASAAPNAQAKSKPGPVPVPLTPTGSPSASLQENPTARALALIDPSPETAQTVLGAYIDWRRAQGVNGIDRRTIGLLAKQLGQAFQAGHPPDIIKRGLVAWHERDQHPSTLASFIDVEARGGQARASPGKAQRQLDDIQRTYQQMQAMNPEGGERNGDLATVDRDRRQAERELP